MRGETVDEDTLIELLCHRTSLQRSQIANAFKRTYDRDLIDPVWCESSGHFGTIIAALLTPTYDFYAREFKETKNVGIDFDTVIEILCSASNRTICGISISYHRLFLERLEDKLLVDKSENVKQFLSMLLRANRDETMRLNIDSARKDALLMKKKGFDSWPWRNDEKVFIDILCTRNYMQIKLISLEYEKLTGHTLSNFIQRELGNDIKDGLLAILLVAHSPAKFFADRFYKALTGIAIDDKALIRLIVTRCEINMEEIMTEMEIRHGQSLKNLIKINTSGQYRKILYCLIGADRSDVFKVFNFYDSYWMTNTNHDRKLLNF